MSRSSRRGPWLPEEDATLLHLVRTQGPNNWVRISQHMQHRSPKQCRERYHQNLKPTLNHDPITTLEGEVIEQLVQEMGKRWAEIARRLGNRSDNAVKNWWNGSMNRRKRNTVPQSGVSKVVGYRSQPIPASAPPSRPTFLNEPPLSSRDTYPPPFSIPPPFRRAEVQQSPVGISNPHFFRTERSHSHRLPPERLLFHEQNDLRSSTQSPHQQQSNNSYPRPPAFNLPQPGENVRLGPQSWPSSKHSDRAEWQLPPLNCVEAPAPSPAATEVSHVSSNQQAPSLVSDDQSNCSISPKTITSPRPGMTATNVPLIQPWLELHRRNSTGTYHGENLDGVDKQRDQGSLPSFHTPVGINEYDVAGAIASPTLPRPLSFPTHASLFTGLKRMESEPTGLQTPKGGPPSDKDSRMNVSRLLE